ncbi:hypothetical protein [Actinoplanes sp. TFC3]|uniref:hypothetical protein n=1 Tax=Actinoplanes sp. TFC3 TaxID=1710355 RepID=UPI0008323682|nr:hypothetical protein [Actinoplanes sp. TFC3]
MPAGGLLGAGNGRSVPAWSDLTGAPSNGFEPSNGFGGPSNGFGGPSNGFGGPSNGFGGASNGFGGANGSNGSGTNGSGTNGSGTNGFHGPRSNEPIPPIPPADQPDAFGDGLPQRRNGEGFRPDETASFGHTIPRQLPPSPETPSRSPFVPPVSAPPVPPTSAPPFGGRPISAPPVSGPPTSAPPVRPQSAPPVRPQSSPPSFGKPPVAQPPVAQPSASPAPPAWPPVSADRDATPHVPESLAAALDMTAELPRYRANGKSDATPAMPEAARSAAAAEAAHEVATQQAAAAQATAAAQIAAAQAAARQRANGDGQSQFADETMELPIFRELESAWFMTARPAEPKVTPKVEPKPAPVPQNDDSVISQRIPTGEPVRSMGVPQQATAAERPSNERTPESVGAVTSNGSATSSNGSATSSSSPWQTAADDGWQAARKAAEMPVETTTTAGLPRRTPMAQLVPGGVDRAETSVQRRTPEAVRGLLSAYHRGVQRGRTKEQSTNPEETPGGQQSSQAGKEHEA